MPQSLNNLLVHVIFSTKNRESLIDADLAPKLHAYIAGICQRLGGKPIRVNGVADHVHILTYIPATLAIATLLRDVKSGSSKWVHQTFPHLQTFAWQSGYAAFSVSQSKLITVRDYIANQEERHKQMSFQDEYRAFLVKHDIEFDERYVWD